MKKEYYLSWRSKKGIPLLVTPLEFVGYGSSFTINGVVYEEQKWRCKLPDGKIATLSFREVKGNDSETSHVENPNPITDNQPDPIQFTREEMEHGKTGTNFMLKMKIKESNLLKRKIKSLDLEGAKEYHKALKSPSMATVNAWRKWVKDNPDKHEKFKEALWSLKEELRSTT